MSWRTVMAWAGEAAHELRHDRQKRNAFVLGAASVALAVFLGALIATWLP